MPAIMHVYGSLSLIDFGQCYSEIPGTTMGSLLGARQQLKPTAGGL